MPTLPPHPYHNHWPPDPPPLPFRHHCDTWRAWGFEGQSVRFMMPADDGERLREFLLYAQARTRGRGWTIWPEYAVARSGKISTLKVLWPVVGGHLQWWSVLLLLLHP